MVVILLLFYVPFICYIDVYATYIHTNKHTHMHDLYVHDTIPNLKELMGKGKIKNEVVPHLLK